MNMHLDSALQDFRYALRQLRKNPLFAVMAAMILAVGIGASAAIFAFVDAALIKPLPYPEPARLVAVTESVPMIPRANLSYLDYQDWKSRNQVFRSLEIYNRTGYLLRSAEGTEVVRGVRVSSGFFRTLGVKPLLGRDFAEGEDTPGGPNVVMLTYAEWQKRFGGRNDVIGQAVTLSDTAATVIGVLPRTFQFAPTGEAGFWTAVHATGYCEKRRGCHNFNGIARLKDGVTLQNAVAEMTTIAQDLERQYPDSNRGQGAKVEPLAEIIVGDIRPILLLLIAAATLLLLIGCVNISSLLLLRSEGRRREIAVRTALGASPARLTRQFVTEALVLVTCGSLAGMGAASIVVRLLVNLVPRAMLARMPYIESLGLNAHVWAFSACAAALAVALFSLAPALRLRFADLRAGLAESSRGMAGTAWRRFGSKLVVAELAIAMVLLAGAGLLGQSLYRLLHVDVGFRPDHLATLQVAAAGKAYDKDEDVVALQRRIIAQLQTLPGVQSVGATNRLPVSSNGNTTWIRFPGKPFHGEHNEVNERSTGTNYFHTIGATLLRGRYFREDEDATKPGVTIINEALAQKYFPGEDPVGKVIAQFDNSPKTMREVVGVIADIKEGPLDSETWPTMYEPFNQSPDNYFAVLVRSSTNPESILPAMPAAIHKLAPDVATVDASTMAAEISDSPSAYLHRTAALLVGGFAGLALLLGAVGLYGVIAYSVSQRTREIGVRMALGAQRRTVYRLILGEAGRLTLTGIAAGLVCSLAAQGVVRKLLFEASPWDALTIMAVTLVLCAAALAASYVPARRAAALDPVEALRAE